MGTKKKSKGNNTGKIDKIKLQEYLREGKSQHEIAGIFGCSDMAVSKMKKTLDLKTATAIVAKEAPQLIAKGLNAGEQLQKINRTMNDLLDLLVKAQKGDDEALVKLAATLELNTKGFDIPALMIKTCGELRQGLALQLKIYETMFQIEAAQQFMEEALDVISSVSPEARNEILRRLNAKNALRANFQAR